MKSDSLTSTLPDFYRWLRVQRDVSTSTYTHHKANIEKFLRENDFYNDDTVREHLAQCKDKLKAGTIENYIYTFRVFNEYLIFKKLLDINWAKAIPLPKRSANVPVILTVAEIEKILYTDLPHTYRHYPKPVEARLVFDTILGILARCGNRISEVVDMRVGDVNLVEGTWTLNNTKTRRGRLVPLPGDLARAVARLSASREPSNAVFYNPISNTPMRKHTVENNFKLRLKYSGIKKAATVHTLRHSFIVEMFKQDVSVLKIANIVGHENIKTTQDYARLLTEDLRDALMRHPMTSKARNPQDILKHLKDIVEKFHLREDPRFMFNLDDSNDGIRISIFLR